MAYNSSHHIGENLTIAEKVTAIIAGYGAVLSTIAIAKQFISERVSVKITVSRDMATTTWHKENAPICSLIGNRLSHSLSIILECPANSVPVAMRQTGM
jgi:hypothetical protein